jgi:hypothetical protein
MGGDSAVSSVWAERGRAARSWRTCEMPPRTWSLGMGCLSVCVKFQDCRFKRSSRLNLTKVTLTDENPTENMQGPRGARLHVTYGSMAGEATANLLHVLLWDILVSEPE